MRELIRRLGNSENKSESSEGNGQSKWVTNSTVHNEQILPSMVLYARHGS